MNRCAPPFWRFLLDGGCRRNQLHFWFIFIISGWIMREVRTVVQARDRYNSIGKITGMRA